MVNILWKFLCVKITFHTIQSAEFYKNINNQIKEKIIEAINYLNEERKDNVLYKMREQKEFLISNNNT